MMQKTTKNLNIRHHRQTISRIQILVDKKAIRKNVGSVLTALANHANKNGFCFPSQETIGAITGYRRETVNRLTKKLNELGFIRKTANRQPIFINNKAYLPRTTYVINVKKITEMIKPLLEASKKKKLVHDAVARMKKSKAAKAKAQTDKNDHSAITKTVTQTTNVLKELNNTALDASPKSGILSIDDIKNETIKHEEAHQKKIKRIAARRSGLKAWRVSKGLEKSTETVRRERKAGNLMKMARQSVKPMLDKFTALTTKLMAWHPKGNPTAFTKSDYELLESVKAEMIDKQVRPPANPLVDYKLNQFASELC